MNSEGKGKRVLARLGIPLATSYLISSSSRTEESGEGEEWKIWSENVCIPL